MKVSLRTLPVSACKIDPDNRTPFTCFEILGFDIILNEKLEAIWNSQHSLKDVIAPSEFKSYDELKQKLDRVLGMTASTATAASVASDMDDVAYPSPEPSIVEPTTASADVEEDDTMSYFQKLANDV